MKQIGYWFVDEDFIADNETLTADILIGSRYDHYLSANFDEDCFNIDFISNRLNINKNNLKEFFIKNDSGEMIKLVEINKNGIGELKKKISNKWISDVDVNELSNIIYEFVNFMTEYDELNTYINPFLLNEAVEHGLNNYQYNFDCVTSYELLKTILKYKKLFIYKVFTLSRF